MNTPRLPGDADDRDRSKDQTSSSKDPGAMTVLEHLAELRTTLLWALGMAAVAAMAAWFVSEDIVDALLRPAHEAGQQTLYFQKPMEGFMLRLKASAVVGLFLVFPLVLHRLYAFVTPGLMPKEKRVVTPLLVSATLLFYLGVGFCYVVLLPLVVRFAMGFATEGLQPWLSAEAYFDMAARLCFAFGVLFELPMVVFVLSWIGLVDPRKLLKGWRYALVLILTVSAVLTPPDVISQVMLAGPVMVLYLLAVVVSIVVRRGRDRERARLRAEDEAAEAAEREADLAARRARTDDPDDDPSPPERPGPVRPRPAEGARQRGAPAVDEAPDRDGEAADDPPWVRDDRGDGDGSAGGSPASDAEDGDEDPSRRDPD